MLYLHLQSTPNLLSHFTVCIFDPKGPPACHLSDLNSSLKMF